jgi:DNA-binding transcriptional LysR family regulator
MADDRRPRADPSVHQLRLFVVLAEELHFGNAARRVFLTQPALSQQIKMLERRLGTRLVERGTHSVELTSAGQELLPAVTSVIEYMDRLQRLADQHGREVTGHLALGTVGGEAAQPYTHKMLAELRRRHPEITVEIRSLGFSRQFHSVARGDVDAAVLLRPVPPELQTLDLSTDSRVALLPANDPLLADGAPLTLAQLADRTFVDIAPPIGREWWDNWSVNPRPDGTSVRYGPVVDDVEALMLAVARGQGIAVLPAAARHLYPRPGIAYVDVVDLPACTAALVWASKNRSHPVVAALREAARTIIAS